MKTLRQMLPSNTARLRGPASRGKPLDVCHTLFLALYGSRAGNGGKTGGRAADSDGAITHQFFLSAVQQRCCQHDKQRDRDDESSRTHEQCAFTISGLHAVAIAEHHPKETG